MKDQTILAVGNGPVSISQMRKSEADRNEPLHKVIQLEGRTWLFNHYSVQPWDTCWVFVGGLERCDPQIRNKQEGLGVDFHCGQNCSVTQYNINGSPYKGMRKYVFIHSWTIYLRNSKQQIILQHQVQRTANLGFVCWDQHLPYV